jgi:hypothetical protein
MSIACPNLMVILTIMVAIHGWMENPRTFAWSGNAVFQVQNTTPATEMRLNAVHAEIMTPKISPLHLFPYRYSLLSVPYSLEKPDFNMVQSSDFIGIPSKSLHTKLAVHTSEMSQNNLRPSLAVNPVYRATSRAVCLQCPSIPLFVKTGSIFPVDPSLQSVSEKATKPVMLFMLQRSHTTCSLCENITFCYDYRNGVSGRAIPYEHEPKTQTSEGPEVARKDMLEGGTFQIIWVNSDRPEGVSYMTQTPQVICYSGDEIIINLI